MVVVSAAQDTRGKIVDHGCDVDKDERNISPQIDTLHDAKPLHLRITVARVDLCAEHWVVQEHADATLLTAPVYDSHLDRMFEIGRCGKLFAQNAFDGVHLGEVPAVKLHEQHFSAVAV